MTVIDINYFLENKNTPFYIYSRTKIDKNIEKFKSINYQNTRIHFASMANDNASLLEIIKKSGFGIFVNSYKHINLAKSASFADDDIIFASTGVSETLMKRLVDSGIHINIDSIDQLRLFAKLGGKTAGLRLNIDEKSKNNVFIGAQSRIGMMESELAEAFDLARSQGVKINGLHVYLGTDVTDLSDFLESVDKTIALSDKFETLEFVDLGGGFPLEADRFDFESYNAEISDRMQRLSERRGYSVRLIIEPGRAMFGDTASFYAQVTDVKERPDRWIVCTNASASLIPRAMFYEDYNPVEVVSSDGGDWLNKPVDVVGSTTYSRDIMARGVTLPKVAVGDWLRFDHAGSYCYSMITRFLGQDLPPEYLVLPTGDIELIRAGEDHTELKASA